MSIYQVIKQIQGAKGSKEKQAILDENFKYTLFENFLGATYDPALSYYKTKLPDVSLWDGEKEFDQSDIDFMINVIAGREVTGNAADTALTDRLSELNNEGRELMKMIIDRSIGASVGDTMVLKTFPILYFVPPYQRCSLLDEKSRKLFSKVDRFYVQTKMDGSFAYAVRGETGIPEAITRQGNTYPLWFADRLSRDNPLDSVVIGEAVVYLDGKLLDRKTGNGILNSILQGGDEDSFGQYEFRHIAWDMLTVNEFELGKSERTYEERYNNLFYVRENSLIVFTVIVDSVPAALRIYSDHLMDGKEGCVAKLPTSLWKDGTAKDIIKLKLKFSADYIITGYFEGEGKLKGMLGGLEIEPSDGGLQSRVGTGFDDKTRKELWEIRDELPGQVVEVEANDVIQSRDAKKLPSLNLPVFIEIRKDKKIADTYERILEQLDAAKNGEQL